jgi:Zn-dependent protease
MSRLLDQLDQGKGSGSPPPPQGGKSRSAWVAVIIGILLFMVTKGKFVILFVLTKAKFLFGALKAGPLMTTVMTMGVSIMVYAQYYGLALAASVVVLILVHELGHGAAAKWMGLSVSAPVFIPFFGALIAMKEQPRSSWVESIVGAGGPLAGMIGAAICLALGSLLGDSFWGGLLLVTGWITALINLFNMIPVFGLDGDRISKPFLWGHWAAATIVAFVAMGLEYHYYDRLQPFMIFICLMGTIKTWKLWRGKPKESRLLDRLSKVDHHVDEDDVKIGHRRSAMVIYVGLLLGLLSLMTIGDALRPAMPQ